VHLVGFVEEDTGNCSTTDTARAFGHILSTLWTGDADLRLYITIVQDG